MNKISIIIKFVLVLFAFALVPTLFAQTPLYLNPNAPVEQRVNDLLNRMTLNEKIGQMMQVDITGLEKNPSDITNYSIGSILSGGDSDPSNNLTKTWEALHDSLQRYALKSRLKIPIIYGIDAVHGNSNIYGATIFPHNIGMGCTRDSALAEKAARVTAEEMAATGIDWAFAPCIAVPRDIRWGRTYEGFGETPQLAEMFGAAEVKGFQGDSLNEPTSVLACAKHYLGDGGTVDGINEGNTVGSIAEIKKIHLAGYEAAVKAGVGSIMVSYSSINGVKMSASKYWITDVLKKQLGFKGIVVSDWGAIDQLGPNYKKDVETSVNAGLDMIMLPTQYKEFQKDMDSLVNEGKVSMARINDAVRRILRIKFMMGVFQRPFSDSSLVSQVGSPAHRAVARQCVRESLVLLKRNAGVLPLPKNGARILVAGDHADNLGYQCGGWTISWQGGSGNTTIGTTILQGMKEVAPNDTIVYSEDGNFANTKAAYSVVVIGEKPYAEGLGDRKNLDLTEAEVNLVKKMKSYGNPVVVILISGRPLIINKILNYSDAIFAAWLPGTEGEGVSDVLFGDYQPTGVLSHSWPRSMKQIPINYGDKNYNPLYKYGYGITSYHEVMDAHKN